MDTKTLLQYYNKYKEVLIPTVIFLISLFIFFKVILSQFSLISDLNAKNSDENLKIIKLQTALGSITSTSKEQLDTYLALTDNALPTSKNILAIFTALNSLATKSNVTIDSFSLSVGSIYSSGKQNVPPQSNDATLGIPTVGVSATVDSNSAQNVIDFSSQLYKTSPLAQIRDLQFSNNRASFDIVFFFKPYDLNFISKESNALPLNEGEARILKTLNNWQNNLQ